MRVHNLSILISFSLLSVDFLSEAQLQTNRNIIKIKDKRIFYSRMQKLSWNETQLHVVLVDLDDYLVSVIQSGNHLGQGSVAEAGFNRNLAHQGFLGWVI